MSAHQVDIMLVNETFLKPSRRDPKIANYRLVRDDRTTGPMGGTLIYYKRSLHCIPIDTPPLISLEASCCRLSMSGHQPITIVSCYCSPTKRLYRSDLEALLSLGSAVILAGDFNSKNTLWGCNVNNTRGNLLESLQEDLHFEVIAPTSPTFYPANINHRPDILDIALTKNVTLQLRSLEVYQDLDSDHRPVLLELGPDPGVSPPATRTVIDWQKLGEALKATHSPDLDRIPDDIATPSDVAVSIDALTNHVRTVISESSKQVPAEGDQRWTLPEDARLLLRAKRAALRAYSWCRTEENRASLRYYERAVRYRLRELRNQRWDDLLSNIDPSHQAYWRLARTLKSDVISSMPPLDRPNLPPALEDADKAECLADSLEDQCSPLLDSVPRRHLDMVESEVQRRSSLPPADSLEPATASEVDSIIKSLKVRKAPGSDGITNKVVKHFSLALVYLLVSIFNAAMSNSMFPDAWKSAEVIGIHKPGKRASEPSSYRPISLLSTLGKIYERVLQKRIWSHVIENNLLPNEQFGFRARHSCVHQVHRITEYIIDGFNTPPETWRLFAKKPMHTVAVFLDVAKAFDKVWHSGLIYKLYQLGLPDRLVLIIQNYLNGRSFRFKVEGDRSSSRPIRAGVPQGSVLAPILFSLYTSDIPRYDRVELALFADDTALYCRGHNHYKETCRLQRALRLVGDWLRNWAISVNPDKSAAMHFFPNRLIKTPDFRIRLHGQRIPWVRSTKYLGVILDDRLTFSNHIKIVRNRAAFFLGRLFPLLNSSSKLSLNNKLTIYKTCIRPVMTYASVAFAHIPSGLGSFQKLQNRFIRKAVGARWFERNADLHIGVELPSIVQYIKYLARRYYDRASNHSNPLIATASNYSTDNLPRDFKRPKDALLDPDDEIAIATSAALGSPDPSAPCNRKYSVFGIGAGYQRQLTHNRPRRRGRRPPSGSVRRSVRISPNNHTVLQTVSATGPPPSEAPGQARPHQPATAQAEVRTVLTVPLS